MICPAGSRHVEFSAIKLWPGDIEGSACSLTCRLIFSISQCHSVQVHHIGIMYSLQLLSLLQDAQTEENSTALQIRHVGMGTRSGTPLHHCCSAGRPTRSP